MRRGRRAVVQIALLPILYGLSWAFGTDGFSAVVAVVLLIGWPISVIVAIALVLIARELPEIESLTDAADNAVSMGFGMTALAGVAIVTLLRVLNVITGSLGPIILVGLGWSLLVFILPSITWARALRQVWIPMLRLRQADIKRSNDE